MASLKTIAPEHTAERVALWRALHVQLDKEPYILKDDVGLKLLGFDESWLSRPDMNPANTRRIRASIVARARFIEDLVEEYVQKGVDQYVILGAGLDTFALRRQDLMKHLNVFEVDQPGPQEWKQNQLKNLKWDMPQRLKFVAVDFEAGQSWWEALEASGFDKTRPAVVVSTGVTMYLTEQANLETFRQMTRLASGSVFATTFMFPPSLLEGEDKVTMENTLVYAKQSGTPFISLFKPEEALALAEKAGLQNACYVSPKEIEKKYFSQRTDGLEAATAEAFLVCYPNS